MTDEGLGASRLTLPGGRDVSLARASSSSVDEGDAWLTPAEAAILDRFRVSKRAADWRLGRWVAKEAVARALGAAALPRNAVEILAGAGGGPRARVMAPGEWPQVSVSLSHSAGVGFAVAAVVREADTMRLGCDVEEIAPRSEEFVSDYFTEKEAAWIRAGAVPGEAAAALDAHAVRANLLWSAKESALKALGEGLRKDTREVVVRVEGAVPPGDGGWWPLVVETAIGDRFAGWWRVADGFVWTVVG